MDHTEFQTVIKDYLAKADAVNRINETAPKEPATDRNHGDTIEALAQGAEATAKWRDELAIWATGTEDVRNAFEDARAKLFDVLKPFSGVWIKALDDGDEPTPYAYVRSRGFARYDFISTEEFDKRDAAGTLND